MHRDAIFAVRYGRIRKWHAEPVDGRDVVLPGDAKMSARRGAVEDGVAEVVENIVDRGAVCKRTPAVRDS